MALAPSASVLLRRSSTCTGNALLGVQHVLLLPCLRLRRCADGSLAPGCAAFSCCLLPWLLLKHHCELRFFHFLRSPSRLLRVSGSPFGWMGLRLTIWTIALRGQGLAFSLLATALAICPSLFWARCKRPFELNSQLWLPCFVLPIALCVCTLTVRMLLITSIILHTRAFLIAPALTFGCFFCRLYAADPRAFPGC